jgi:hypothetical protein
MFNEANAVENFIRDLTPAAGAAPPLRCGEGAGKRSAPGVRSDGAVAPLRRGRRVQPAGVRSL